MYVVAIVLCDNDFGTMFVPLLKGIHEAIKYRGEKNCTEEYITRLVLEGIGYYYLAYQQQASEQDYQSTTDYLKMKIKVLFDVEALDFISKNDHDSGSWYLTTVNGQVGYF